MSNIVQTPSTAMSGYNNFNMFYALTRQQVGDLLTELNTSNFLDNIQLLFENPIENVVNLRVYPFDVKLHHPVGSAIEDSSVIINVVTMETKGFSLNPVPSPPFNLGKIEIPKHYNNFLDYSPYTKIELYLPYVDFVTLDTNLVMGKTISIDYVVDYFSGKCTAFISVEETVDGVTTSNIIMERDGNIGVEVAIGGGRGADIARNMLKLGIGAGVGAIAMTAGAVSMGAGKTAGSVGSVAGAVSMSAGYLANTTVNAIQAGQAHITKGGSAQPAINFYAPQNCYLVITRPNVVTPSTYNRDFGRPCGKTFTLGALTGFTVVDSIHVEGVPTATSDEITEIERLLKQGVIL